MRNYLPLPQVLEGLFSLIYELFDVSVIPADPENKNIFWHTDVLLYEMYDKSTEKKLAYLFLDLFARPGQKRPGSVDEWSPQSPC